MRPHGMATYCLLHPDARLAHRAPYDISLLLRHAAEDLHVHGLRRAGRMPRRPGLESPSVAASCNAIDLQRLRIVLCAANTPLQIGSSKPMGQFCVGANSKIPPACSPVVF